MHRYLLRAITLGVVLLMLGCSGGGGSPTAPDPVGDNETSANPNDLTGTSIPGLTSYSDEERIIGNFSYETEDGNRLAWGTVYLTPEGWDYRVDYISPRLKALMQSDVTRNAQGLVDLTWLKLIGVEVDYAKEPEEPNPIPLFNPGELMDYDVIIHNNTHRVIPRQLAAATQVDMFNNPLGDDATDLWTDIRIGNDGDDVVLLTADNDVDGDQHVGQERAWQGVERHIDRDSPGSRVDRAAEVLDAAFEDASGVGRR